MAWIIRNRDELINALCNIGGEVAVTGPLAGKILADSMADAILSQLTSTEILECT